MPQMSIPIDFENHGRYWLLAAAFIVWFITTNYGSSIASFAKSTYGSLRASGKLKISGGSIGWLAALVAVIMYGPGSEFDRVKPSPEPDIIVTPDEPKPVIPTPVEPKPEVKQDLFDRSVAIYRQLLADAVEEFSRQNFAGDDEAAKFLNLKIDAAVQGGMADVDRELDKATHAGPERAKQFADALRASKLEKTP